MRARKIHTSFCSRCVANRTMHVNDLLIITNEPISTLHIAALDIIILWVVSPTTLSNFDFTRSMLSRLFTSSLMSRWP